MSIPLIGIQPTQAYIGVVNRMPIRQSSGYVPRAGEIPPSVVPVFIEWNVYWQVAGNPSSVAVEVNLQAQSVQASILDRIASVKIDNTGSAVPIYVWFKDTNDVVTCPPNTVIIVPVLTNNLTATILAIGLTAGNIPQTRIFFSNVILPPNVDPEIDQAVARWLASPTITRGNTILNQNYGVPALGDQAFSTNMSLASGNGAFVRLWGTPRPSGFLYLTGIQINILQVKGLVDVQSGAIFLESIGVAGVLYVMSFFYNNFVDTFELMSRSGMNLKLDATQTWQLRYFSNVGQVPSSGFVQSTSEFTINPN